MYAIQSRGPGRIAAIAMHARTVDPAAALGGGTAAFVIDRGLKVLVANRAGYALAADGQGAGNDARGGVAPALVLAQLVLEVPERPVHRAQGLHHGSDRRGLLQAGGRAARVQRIQLEAHAGAGGRRAEASGLGLEDRDAIPQLAGAGQRL